VSNSRLASLDARIHATLKRAGLADGGTGAGDGAILRRMPSGTETACRVFVTRNAERIGAQGQPIFIKAVIAVLLADITTPPAKGDRFVIGDETFTVDAKESQDESSVTLQCKEGL
jgi:hypothetical protein